MAVGAYHYYMNAPKPVSRICQCAKPFAYILAYYVGFENVETLTRCLYCAKPLPPQKRRANMRPGDIVRYFDAGWRFATLLKIHGLKAQVEHPLTGVHWVALENVEQWNRPPYAELPRAPSTAVKTPLGKHKT